MDNKEIINNESLKTVSLILFLVGIAQRVFWYIHSEVWVHGLVGANIAMSDAGAYIAMSYDLLSYAEGHERLPMLPLLIAVLREMVGPEIWKIVIFNQIVSILSAIVLFKLLRNCLPKRWALLATSIYVAEPITAYFSNGVNTDTVFSTLVLASVTLFVWAAKRKSFTWLAASCFTFGLCILTRPNGWYFVYIVPCLAVWQMSGNLMFRLRAGIIALSLILTPIIPWIVAQHLEYGSFGVSTSAARHLIDIEAARTKAHATGLPMERVVSELNRKAKSEEIDNPFERASAQKKVALGIFLDYPLSYLVVKAKATVKLFFSTGNRRLCTTYLNKSLESTDAFKALNYLPFLSRIVEKIKYRSRQMTDCEWVVGGGVAFINLLIYFGIGVSVLSYRGIIKKCSCSSIVWPAIIMVGYFSLFVHSAVEARFRLPMVPFLLTLSTFGYYRLCTQRNGITQGLIRGEDR